MFRMWLLITVLALTGCGAPQPSGDVVAVVPASGVITLKGKPIEFYQVSTIPETGRAAVGVTDASGKFILGTNEPDDGAMVGTHKVAVTWVGPPNTDPGQGIMEMTPPPAPTVKIDAKYQNAETSGLSIQVPEGGTQELKIELM